MSRIDRNGPCPCGSGKKYKKCCAWKDAAKCAAENRPAADRDAPGGEPVQEQFIAERKPEVDAELDRLLQRMQRGEGETVRARLLALYAKHPGYHMTNYAMGTYVGMVEGDPVGSIPFFEKAVRVFPPFAEAHYNLCLLYTSDAADE